ncbi:hypothetical protein ACN26Y_07625 [Micromonospora sp. WMMD558]|uniref:hypothetical protein n=1 Tax=unclassified Micromonospora TaxID=2617518 RepID=UPI0018AFE86A|nr:hypothetical protein [Micromonospora sp. WMMC415]
MSVTRPASGTDPGAGCWGTATSKRVDAAALPRAAVTRSAAGALPAAPDPSDADRPVGNSGGTGRATPVAGVSRCTTGSQSGGRWDGLAGEPCAAQPG